MRRSSWPRAVDPAKAEDRGKGHGAGVRRQFVSAADVDPLCGHLGTGSRTAERSRTAVQLPDKPRNGDTTAFDPNALKDRRKRPDSADPDGAGHGDGVPRGPDSQPDALRAAGDRPEDTLLPRAIRPQPAARAAAERLVLARLALGVSGAGDAGGDVWGFGLGPTVQLQRVQHRLGRRGLRHGAEFPGRVGDSHSGVRRSRKGPGIGGEGGVRRGVLEGRHHHDLGHSLHRPVPRLGVDLGRQPTAAQDLRRLYGRRPGDGQPVSLDRRISQADRVPAEARRVDGHL